ncbi:MAG: hypothetical protein GPJ51_13910 [Candidatus Heimdallarchaeota archaeon]|nr:hypothetical protein [Candidatus Heimdallarchaeota archaeon]
MSIGEKNEKQNSDNQPSIKKRELTREQPFKPDDICKTYCSLSNNKQECSKVRKEARNACSLLLKRYSGNRIEQAILGETGFSLEDLLKQVLKEKKLKDNDKVVLCAQRELTNQLMKIKVK